MLKGEIWLKVIIQADIEGFTITIAPVFAVISAIFFYFISTESGGALFVTFR